MATGVYVQPKTDCPHILTLASHLNGHQNTNIQKKQPAVAETAATAHLCNIDGISCSVVSRFNVDTFGKPCTVCGDGRENWLCLGCEQVFCSRYVNGHMAAHNHDEEEGGRQKKKRSTQNDENDNDGEDNDCGGCAEEHHHSHHHHHHNIALSFSDASVWCFACDSYIVSDALFPLLRKFSRVKFGDVESSAACAKADDDE